MVGVKESNDLAPAITTAVEQSKESLPSAVVTTQEVPAPSRSEEEQKIYDRGGQVPLSVLLQQITHMESTADLTEYAAHYSGYLREAAIVRCIELRRPELLLALIERLNDFVPQVRQAARDAFSKLLPIMSADTFIPLLPGLYALINKSRLDHGPWVAQMETALIQKIPTDTLIEAVKTSSTNVARGCFRLLLQTGSIAPPDAIRLALGTKDLILLLQAFQLCRELGAGSREEFLQQFARCHYGSIRLAALRLLLADLRTESKIRMAREFLYDTQASVRDFIISWLKDAGYDAHDEYSAQLAIREISAERVRVSLLALAKFRHPSDLAVIISYTTAVSVRIRLAAMTSWFKFEPDRKDRIAALALRDRSESIRKYALQLVSKHGAFVARGQIFALVDDPHSHGLAIRLAQRNKWEWLECIALLARKGMTSENDRVMLARQLMKWRKSAFKGYEAPDAQQIAFFTDQTTMDALSVIAGRSFERFRAELKAWF